MGYNGTVSMPEAGERVVVRVLAGVEDGRQRYRDITGVLLSTADPLMLRRDDGTEVSVPAGEVHRLKAIPPGVSQIVELERIAAAGWPAPRTERLGHWLLRAGDGWTRRANSALVLGSPGRPVDRALAEVADFYRAAGLVPRLAVPLPAMVATDHAAAAAGWLVDVDSVVLTRTITATAADEDVRVDDVPPDGWTAVYRARPITPGGWHTLTGGGTVGFASLVDGGEPVAVGRGVVTDGWLGVSSMEVLPSHRRRGLATRVLDALLAWGHAHGAGRCYLQTEVPNTGARATYAAAGFRPHHRYRLRVLAPD